jgi:RNA recognition motif-containing protein
MRDTGHSFLVREKRKKGAIQMATRIYVGGMPYSATEQELQNLFAKHGSVTSATIITDKYTGQAKGFGFVEMSTETEAKSAIDILNGTLMGDRTLTVNEAKPREERSGSNGYGAGRSGGYNDSRG